mmetsp:Transcript_82214/g.266222  ORF Transcript_82214/g.266222 Transcript_82214/m.266222 type:complete len:262 (+) Transcript_82214:70-855(+)
MQPCSCSAGSRRAAAAPTPPRYSRSLFSRRAISRCPCWRASSTADLPRWSGRWGSARERSSRAHTGTSSGGGCVDASLRGCPMQGCPFSRQSCIRAGAASALVLALAEGLPCRPRRRPRRRGRCAAGRHPLRLLAEVPQRRRLCGRRRPRRCPRAPPQRLRGGRGPRLQSHKLPSLRRGQSSEGPALHFPPRQRSLVFRRRRCARPGAGLEPLAARSGSRAAGPTADRGARGLAISTEAAHSTATVKSFAGPCAGPCARGC